MECGGLHMKLRLPQPRKCPAENGKYPCGRLVFNRAREQAAPADSYSDVAVLRHKNIELYNDQF